MTWSQGPHFLRTASCGSWGRIRSDLIPTTHLVALFTWFFLSVLPQWGFSQPRYEFRGVWIATVDNIDWPLRGDHNSASQKAEFVRQLDLHRRNGMNAVIVQIRPAADAFFPSSYEPWSEWLTGKQGTPPSAYYDPLEFMIEETHKRGMEFHAWCNPYRATFKIGQSTVSPTHITRLHPGWFINYGDTRYFDPGNKEVQRYVTDVIADIVRRYDIDAIHFDDYFYPYRIPGSEFADDASFSKYGQGMTKDQWRRSNVDSIILSVGLAIKRANKLCRFGISPFGVWRNRDRDSSGSETHAGQTNYDDLYADILLWLREGWIDYVVPQIYWEFGHRAAPYEVLIDWWSKHSYGRQCYVGIGIYKAGTNPAWRDPTQVPRQIAAARNAPGVQGMVYFSSTSFLRNPYGWNDSLQSDYYKSIAFIPPMSWIDSTRPSPPVLQSRASPDTGLIISLSKNPNDPDPKGFAIYQRDAPYEGGLDTAVAYGFIPFAPDARFILPHQKNPDAPPKFYFVTIVSRTNNESRPAAVSVN